MKKQKLKELMDLLNKAIAREIQVASVHVAACALERRERICSKR